MSDIKTCPHLNEIIDEHEGTIICHDCGLVIDDKYYLFDDKSKEIEQNDICKEILARLNLSEEIAENICLENTRNICSIASKLYLAINKTSSVTLKEIAGVTGICEKQLNQKTKGNITVLDKDKLLEKYCTYLLIPFKSYTVIKEMLNKLEISGHNPLTIIASCIYIYCKKNSIKLSMKKLAEVIGISCVSIQRFLKIYKNELSHWC